MDNLLESLRQDNDSGTDDDSGREDGASGRGARGVGHSRRKSFLDRLSLIAHGVDGVTSAQATKPSGLNLGMRRGSVRVVRYTRTHHKKATPDDVAVGLMTPRGFAPPVTPRSTRNAEQSQRWGVKHSRHFNFGAAGRGSHRTSAHPGTNTEVQLDEDGFFYFDQRQNPRLRFQLQSLLLGFESDLKKMSSSAALRHRQEAQEQRWEQKQGMYDLAVSARERSRRFEQNRRRRARASHATGAGSAGSARGDGTNKFQGSAGAHRTRWGGEKTKMIAGDTRKRADRSAAEKFKGGEVHDGTFEHVGSMLTRRAWNGRSPSTRPVPPLSQHSLDTGGFTFTPVGGDHNHAPGLRHPHKYTRSPGRDVRGTTVRTRGRGQKSGQGQGQGPVHLAPWTGKPLRERVQPPVDDTAGSLRNMDGAQAGPALFMMI